MTRGSFQTATRGRHPSSVRPSDGVSEGSTTKRVSSSARTTSMSTSMTSVPRAVGDLAQRPAHPGRVGVGHLHQGEVGRARPCARRGGLLGPGPQPGPGVRIGDGGPAAGARRGRATSRQPGQARQQVGGPHPHHVGQGQGHHVGAPGRGHDRRPPAAARRSPRRPGCPSRFQLSGRSAASDMSAISCHPLVGDGPDGGDELEGGARVVADGPGQGHELVEGGRAGRDRVAVAVEVALAQRRGEARAHPRPATPPPVDHGRELRRRWPRPGWRRHPSPPGARSSARPGSRR